MKLIVDLLEVSSSMRGQVCKHFLSSRNFSILQVLIALMSVQDVKDCLLGRLFAYGAIVRSGRLTNEMTSDKSYIYVKDFVSSLISLASRKQYLQEPSVVIILELVDKVLFNLLE